MEREEDGANPLDEALIRRLDALSEEGQDFWHDFDATVRQERWHSFVAADYDLVRAALLPLRRPGRPFLEWGSAHGVITIMADLLGFDACGIEIDPDFLDTYEPVAAI